MADFDVSWSFAAFRKVGKAFVPTHQRILKELEEVTTHTDDWFFHAVEIENGWLRCDASPHQNRWQVSVREARYVKLPPRPDAPTPLEYPESIETADNDRFATFDALLAEAAKQQKSSRFRRFLSKAGFPLSRE